MIGYFEIKVVSKVFTKSNACYFSGMYKIKKTLTLLPEISSWFPHCVKNGHFMNKNLRTVFLFSVYLYQHIKKKKKIKDVLCEILASLTACFCDTICERM